MTQNKIKIDNLKCQGCVDNITKALKKNKNIDGIEFDIPNKILDVSYNENKIEIEKIEKIINKVGYNTEVI